MVNRQPTRYNLPMRYRLRTLLIVLALGPLVIWAGWLVRESLRPKRNPWYIYDQAESAYHPPGPVFKLERKARRIILPDENRSSLPGR